MNPNTPTHIPLNYGSGKTRMDFVVADGQNVATQRDDIKSDEQREARHAVRVSSRRQTRRQKQKASGRPEYQPFANALRTAMDKVGFSASDLARAAWGSTTNKRGNSVARNRDRIGHYLAGTSYPTPENLQLLADALDIPVDTLAIERPQKENATAEPARRAALHASRHTAKEGFIEILMPPVSSDLATLTVSSRQMSVALALKIADQIRNEDIARKAAEKGLDDQLGTVVGGTDTEAA